MDDASSRDGTAEILQSLRGCSKCSVLKNYKFRHRGEKHLLHSRGNLLQRWSSLLALTSWHSASVLLLVALLSTWKGVGAQKPPPNYAHGNMPVTNFTCDHKTTGGYYADPEAGCQMFHVCVRISEEEINDYKFLCPNNTVFDQKNFICTNWWEIDCEMSTKYYSKNDLFKPATESTPQAELEYVDDPEPVYYEYVYEYVDPEPPAARNTQPKHRLSLGKSAREEKAIEANEEPASLNTNTEPLVSSSVSVSKPRATFSTSSIKRTSIDFSDSSRTLGTTKTTPSSTTTTTTTTRPATPVTSVSFTSFASSPTSKKRFESQDIIGQSVIKPVFKNESEDPFADYDWKKESADLTPRSKDGGTTPTTNRRTTTKSETRFRDRTGHRNSRRTDSTKNNEEANRKDELSEFSNFRFYKTAFGVSYSSDDYFTTTETPQPQPVVPHGRSATNLGEISIQESEAALNSSPKRGSRRFRKTDDQTAKSSQLRSKLRKRSGIEQRRRGRTASRQTRYSIYAR